MLFAAMCTVGVSSMCMAAQGDDYQLYYDSQTQQQETIPTQYQAHYHNPNPNAESKFHAAYINMSGAYEHTFKPNTYNTNSSVTVNSDLSGDNNYSLSVAVGRNFMTDGTPFRVQLRYTVHPSYGFKPVSVTRTGSTNGNLEASADFSQYMLDVYYDLYGHLAHASDWIPYLGIGLGMAKVNVDSKLALTTGATENYGITKNTQFAWDVEGGVNKMLFDTFSLGAFVRYTNFGNVNVASSQGYKADGLSGLEFGGRVIIWLF